MLTDQIADMFNRIRNACKEKKKTVTIPASGIKKELTKLLYDQHFISKYAYVNDSKQGLIKILLKYNQALEPTIQGLRRISKPGRRVYRKTTEIPKVLGGMGVAIITTPKGLMTDKECRTQKVGGEVIGYVW